MAYSLSRPRPALALALALAACPEPCPEDQQDPAPTCAPVDRGTIALANSSFEGPHAPLAGWSLADAPDVAASLIPGVDGCTAVSLARADGQPIEFPARYTHTLDAAALRRQRVRLSLWARVDGDKKAHPAVALRASAGRRRVLLDMRSARMKGEGWRLHAVEFDVPPDSDRLHLVVGLGGARRVDLDGAVLDRLGPACPGCDPPAPLSDHDLENLSALTRLFGHVRWFHASLESRDVDWDRLALAGVQAALRADDPAGLAVELQRVFRPVAPSLRIAVGAAPEPAPPQGALELVRVNHGKQHSLFPRNIIEPQLPGVALPDPADPARLDLGRGLVAVLPLAVAVDPAGWWNTVAPVVPLDKPPGFAPDLGDRVTRLAAIVALAARLQHFSPRLDRAAFAPVLADSLRRAATARDRYDLRAVVYRLLAATGESAAQAHVDDDAALGFSLVLQWTWLAGQLVISATDERAPDLRVGDVVEAIDGRAVEAVLAEQLELAWGATDARRRTIAASLARRAGPGGPLGLQVRRQDGSEHHVKVRFAHNSLAPRSKPRDELADLEGGLLYVDLGRTTAAELRAASTRIAGATGLVLDVRSELEPDVLSLFRATLGDLGEREHRRIIWPEGQPNPLAPQQPAATDDAPLPLPARLAVLVGSDTQGDSEPLADALRHRRGASLVGMPTVGAPTRVATITLPGGLVAAYTEDAYRYASGHPSFAPLQPDILAAPTRESIAEGRDPALAAAAAALRATR